MKKQTILRPEAEIFFDKMINLEKFRAAERFTGTIPVEKSIIDSINRNPGLVKDRGFKQNGVRSIVSIYKSSLYRLGVRPDIIAEGATNLAQGLNNADRKVVVSRIKEVAEMSVLEPGVPSIPRSIKEHSGRP